jgi:hypothetical protein
MTVNEQLQLPAVSPQDKRPVLATELETGRYRRRPGYRGGEEKIRYPHWDLNNDKSTVNHSTHSHSVHLADVANPLWMLARNNWHIY